MAGRCKRISTKLLRKVVDYLNNIHAHLKIEKFKEIRANKEELVLQGPEGPHDVRIIQSYPSKVVAPPPGASHRIVDRVLLLACLQYKRTLPKNQATWFWRSSSHSFFIGHAWRSSSCANNQEQSWSQKHHPQSGLHNTHAAS